MSTELSEICHIFLINIYMFINNHVLQNLSAILSGSNLVHILLFRIFCSRLMKQIKTHQSERMSLFISPHVNQHHHHPSSSSSATDSLVARVHTQLYLSIESNRKICRLQLGRVSIRKTTETMKPKSSPSPSGSGSGTRKI